MRKRILSGVAFLTLTGLVWAANEPWKTKPYQQWDKTDLAVILDNSPWAKKVVVDVAWKPSAAATSQNGQRTSDADPEFQEHLDKRKGGAPDTSPPDASMSSAASSGGASGVPKTTFYIRWYSSRTVREALAREAILNGRISEAEGAKLLAEPVTNYEIIVFGPDMTPFQNLTEDQLKAASYLEGKQSKQKVTPASIRLNKAANGATSSLVFTFPEKTDSGAQVASAQEKEIEFTCKVTGLGLHSVFDARKMVDEKGADF